jgi:hypothetical protein
MGEIRKLQNIKYHGKADGQQTQLCPSDKTIYDNLRNFHLLNHPCLSDIQDLRQNQQR